MNIKLDKNEINRFSRQIILKNIGSLGQQKIIKSKVLIIGMGGLGCPVAEFLARAGVGTLGIVDNDLVDFSTFSDSSNSANWISVFGIANEKAPMPNGAYFTDDTLQTANCSNCSKNRFPGHEEWLFLFANETLISPYQDGHYIYIVIPGSGSGIDTKSPILFVADAENPSKLYKLINI